MRRQYAFRCGLCVWETELTPDAAAGLAVFLEHVEKEHPFAAGYVARLRRRLGGDG